MIATYDDSLEQFGDDVIRVSPLKDLSDELIEESISEQISNPFSSKSDFLEEFKENMNNDIEEAGEDDDMVNEIAKTSDNFYTKVLQLLDKQFKLGLDEDLVYSLTGDSLRNFCEGLYEFFVINYEENLSTFITKRIIESKDAICDVIKGDRKDVVSISYKNKIKDPSFAVILANIGAAIMAIKDLEIEPEDFIEYFNEERFDTAILRYGIENHMINGDFIENFVKPVYPDTKTDINDIITIEVQHGVFDKYRSENEPEEQEEEE